MSNLHPVFVRAKEILLTEGWYCGGPRGPQEETCIIIACVDAYEDVYGVSAFQSDDFIRIHRILADIINVPLCGVPPWNDNPTRTLEEVIAALDEAILLTAPVVELVGSS